MNEIPRLNQPMRSGNRAFRTFLTRVYTERADILSGVSTNPDTHEYFVQSFGIWTRIDFGTGHEFNFQIFMTSLAVLELLQPEDCVALEFDVFWTYWNLLLPFRVGITRRRPGRRECGESMTMSQLIDHPEITPANVINPDVAMANRDEYAYCK
jgi:hypothetical protein